MPEEKIEKVTYQVKGKFFSGEQQVNKEGIETLYANWKNACEQFNEE